MLEIRMRRAMAPDEIREDGCGVCGLGLVTETVYAWLNDAHSSAVCPACVEYLSGRNPEDFPTTAELAEANRRFAAPAYPSVEAIVEIEQSDDEAAHAAMDDTYWGCWLPRGDTRAALSETIRRGDTFNNAYTVVLDHGDGLLPAAREEILNLLASERDRAWEEAERHKAHVS